MTPHNFCQQTQWITTGQGFKRDLPIVYSDFLVTASGVPVTGSSAPTAVVSGISFDDGETALLRIVLPGDYDSTQDYLTINLLGSCATGAAGDTLGLGSSCKVYRDGGTAAGTSVNFATAPDDQAVVGTTNTKMTFNLSGSGLQPGDIVELTITAANSSTSELIVKGGFARYKSNLALTNKTER